MENQQLIDEEIHKEIKDFFQNPQNKLYNSSNEKKYKAIIELMTEKLIEAEKEDKDYNINLPKYLIDYKGYFSYKGYLNSKFERELFGINFFSSNSIYIGEFKNDKMNGVGFYLYDDNKKFYFGKFNNGKKKDKGLFIWRNESNIEESLINNSYDAFLGNLNENQMIEGLYFKQVITKENEYRFIYKGKFKDNLFHDKHAILIDLTNNFSCLGEFNDNYFICGYVLNYIEQNNNISTKDILRFNLEEKKNEIQKNEKEILSSIVELISKNYFVKIHDYYHNILQIGKQYHSIESIKYFNLEYFANQLLQFEYF